jgi:hypothetical protein
MCGDQKNRQLGKKFKGSQEIFFGAAVLTGHSLAGDNPGLEIQPHWVRRGLRSQFDRCTPTDCAVKF